MHPLRFLTRLTLIASLLLPSMALAQASSSSSAGAASETCRGAVEKELAKEQRLYRSVVYGQPAAQDATVGTVRYDEEGTAWIKTTDDEWGTAAMGKREDTKSNDEMSDTEEHESRRGIFSTRGVRTSELIPPLLQSMRALRCRAATVCQAVNLSAGQQGKESQTITVETMGCLPIERPSIAACHLAANEETIESEKDAAVYCSSISGELLDREAMLLRMAVEYDAAYRSLLQLAGLFDAFIDEWRWTLLGTLRETVGIMGSLQRIPCFVSSCEETPEPEPIP